MWGSPVVWAALAVLCGWLFSGAIWWQAKQDADSELRQVFASQSGDFTRHIERYLDAKALVLQGFGGLFKASDYVSRSDFPAMCPVSPTCLFMSWLPPKTWIASWQTCAARA